MNGKGLRRVARVLALWFGATLRHVRSDRVNVNAGRAAPGPSRDDEESSRYESRVKGPRSIGGGPGEKAMVVKAECSGLSEWDRTASSLGGIYDCG